MAKLIGGSSAEVLRDFVRRFGYNPSTGTKRTTIYKIWKVH